MKEGLKYIGYGLAGLLVIFMLSQFGNALGLWNISFWGVKKENARREVFEQTQSYVEGKRQELLKLRTEYLNAEDEQAAAAIKFTIQQNFANVKDDHFDGVLGEFLRKMKYD